MSNECEALLSDGSDLVAEEMKFELGWNSTSTTQSLNIASSDLLKNFIEC